MSGTLRVYGCGGCGMNLIQSRIDIPKFDPYANVEMVGIDTSEANYDKSAGIPFYQIPGVSGMGKDRGEMLGLGRDKIDPILRDYKPGTMNVVVASLSGGSGSMIAALLIRELLSRNLPCVLMGIASTDSGKEAENSLKSMQTLQQINKSLQAPIPFFYYENTESESQRYGDGPRDKVDAFVNEDIRDLALLVSEKHRELDRQDITNFFGYHRVSSVKPMMVEVRRFSGEVDNDACEKLKGHVIATASLLNDSSQPIPAMDQPYETFGYYQDDFKDEFQPLTWILTTYNVSAFVEALAEKDKRFKEVEVGLNQYDGIDVDGDDDFIV